MASDRWDAVDEYLMGALLPDDTALTAALAASAAAGLPEIAVSPPQGALLAILARAVGAKRILEIGTLGGYSAICMARALPKGGRLVSLEVDPKHAEVARANIAAAGLADVAEVRLGRAIDALPKIAESGEGPFDFVFIDADKPSNAAYFDWAVKLARPGSLIIVDNVVRGGTVADARSRDASVAGAREALEMMGKDARVAATALQTVGLKGYDGFAIAVVR